MDSINLNHGPNKKYNPAEVFIKSDDSDILKTEKTNFLSLNNPSIELIVAQFTKTDLNDNLFNKFYTLYIGNKSTKILQLYKSMTDIINKL